MDRRNCDVRREDTENGEQRECGQEHRFARCKQPPSATGKVDHLLPVLPRQNCARAKKESKDGQE